MNLSVMEKKQTENGNGKKGVADNALHSHTKKEDKNVAQQQTGIQTWIAQNGITLLLAVVAFVSTFSYLQAEVNRQRDEAKELKSEFQKLRDEREKDRESREKERVDLQSWLASTQNKLSKIEGLLENQKQK